MRGLVELGAAVAWLLRRKLWALRVAWSPRRGLLCLLIFCRWRWIGELRGPVYCVRCMRIVQWPSWFWGDRESGSKQVNPQ